MVQSLPDNWMTQYELDGDMLCFHMLFHHVGVLHGGKGLEYYSSEWNSLPPEGLSSLENVTRASINVASRHKKATFQFENTTYELYFFSF